MEEPEFKQKFIERYSQLTDWERFKNISLQYLRRSIRVNTLKTTVKEIKQRLSEDWKLTQIPWCKEGFWIEHKHGRRDVGNLLEHTLGYIYIQEAVSMIPPIVLDPQPGETILDMCAAPGSKCSQIIALMKNTGVVIANDFKGDRIKSLGINMQRVGALNSLVTLMEGRWFIRSGLQFDRVLCDAPCSGTGTIRKSLKTLRIWNPNMVRRLAGIQRQLLDTAFTITKPGGVVVYSTCTLEPEEDEAVVSWLLEKYDNARLEKITLPGLKSSEPITSFNNEEYNPDVKKCLRLWPQDNDTEGFFVAKIRKKQG